MRQTRRTAGPRLVRLGVVLVIVLGVFGMHALSHHGSTHQSAPVAVSAVSVEDAVVGSSDQAHRGHLAGHAVDRAAETSQHAAPGRAPDSGAGHGGEGVGGSDRSLGEVVMLCVAMLVAAATLWWLLNLLRRVPRMWAVLRPSPTRAGPASWLLPTGTGPPPVWQFSVIRC